MTQFRDPRYKVLRVLNCVVTAILARNPLTHHGVGLLCMECSGFVMGGGGFTSDS